MKNINTYLLLLMLTPLVGCQGAKVSSSLGSVTGESLTGGQANQAPTVKCSLYRNSDASTFRTLSSQTGEDTFTSTPVKNDVARFDCSGTQDESSASQLSYFIDQNYNPAAPNFVAVSGAQFSESLSNVGRFPMALKVVDPQGLATIKTFTMVVQCAVPVIPVVDLSQVSVTASSKLNFFNYSVPAAAVSGGQNFQFSWDFNGDGEYDPYSLSSTDLWTPQNTLNNIYSIFVTTGTTQTRKVSFSVKNDCEVQTDYTIAVKLENENIARNPTSLAVIKPYFYLQSDVSDAADLNNPRRNVEFLGTQYPEDQATSRIECDYHKDRYAQNGAFTMKAYNWYKSGADFLHGQEIKVNNIVDSGAAGTQTIPSMSLDEVQYQVSSQDDAAAHETYVKNSACTITMRIIRQVGVTPCTDTTNADFTESEAITILGEFSCPTLTDSDISQSVAVNNGKFYCQVAPVNQCVGGGGGGGGNPPPEQ